MADTLTESQKRLLLELARRGGQGDMFAPNRAVVNALRKRGLITEQFHGMRVTTLRLTTKGQQIIMKEESHD